LILEFSTSVQFMRKAINCITACELNVKS
jgi:hypothetical protein